MEEQNEKMELRHDPVEGYPKIFKIAVIVGVTYLALVFLKSLFF